MDPLRTTKFTVHRNKPELITPAESTPYEIKRLSDIDDQGRLRSSIPEIFQIYRNQPSKKEVKNPVKVIREALAKALVYYYPLAGRLSEYPGKKLVVECTGEGILFTEADGDFTLEQFGDPPCPPFSGREDLVYTVPGFTQLLHSPLLLIQVTRLRCGGFILAIRFKHPIADGRGIAQFITAVAEIARGASAPTVLPVWQRELLSAREPPSITCKHPEFEPMNCISQIHLPKDEVHCSFFFGPAELQTIRSLISQELHQSYTSFDILTSFLWRCQVLAFEIDPEEEVRAFVIVNTLSKFGTSLPKGYYGNTIASPAAWTTAGKLCKNPLEYALKLVKMAKDSVDKEYMYSLADLMVIKGRPHIASSSNCIRFSDLRKLGFKDVDYGWGKAAFGGAAKARSATPYTPGIIYYVSCRNNRGIDGTLALACFSSGVMEKFARNIECILGKISSSQIISSSL